MNSVMIIRPYLCSGIWVFDDPVVGLVREPFVGDMNLLITALVIDSELDGDIQFKFNLMFSAGPFPSYTHAFERLHAEDGGTWYHCPALLPRIKGWLCPALFKYFPEAPEKIYVCATE